MAHLNGHNETTVADGANGRHAAGKFTAGNRHGRGNPHAKKAHAIRQAAYRAVSTADVVAMVKAQVEKAKGGDTIAFREVMLLLLGKPVAADIVARISELENELGI